MNPRIPLLSLSLLMSCHQASAADRVIQGSRDVEGSPFVVSLSDICMGVLLHPHAVVYPAHCGTQHETVRGQAGSRPTTRCEAIPDWNTEGRDIAYCLLGQGEPEKAQGLSVLPSCAHELAVGDRLDLLAQSDDFAETASVTLSAGPTDMIASNPQVGVCPGASGGPAFYQIESGDDVLPRLAGLISAGEFGCELGKDIYLSPIQPYLGWLEQRTGLDLTPCMDDDGRWELSHRCLDRATPDAELGGCGRPLFPEETSPVAIEEAEILLEGEADSLRARFSVSASPESEIAEVEVTLSSPDEPTRVQRRRWELLEEIEFRGLASNNYTFDLVVTGRSGDQAETRRSLDLSAPPGGCHWGARHPGSSSVPGGSFICLFGVIGGAISRRRKARANNERMHRWVLQWGRRDGIACGKFGLWWSGSLQRRRRHGSPWLAHLRTPREALHGLCAMPRAGAGRRGRLRGGRLALHLWRHSSRGLPHGSALLQPEVVCLAGKKLLRTGGD